MAVLPDIPRTSATHVTMLQIYYTYGQILHLRYDREEGGARMSELLLKDVIDFERDIEPYRFVQIYAGVGSGKNDWARYLMANGYRVLLITSRKITADAEADKSNAARYIDLDSILDKEDWEFECLFSEVTRNVICTNSGLAKFIKNHFSAKDKRTYLWNKFDFIILDEAHSLSTDATFADAPFHVEKFFSYAIEHGRSDCHFVFMTGTLDPIRWLLRGHEKDVHVINCFDKCRHVDPKRVSIIAKRVARQRIIQSLRHGHRAIYFANTIKNMTGLIAYLKEQGLSEENIGVMYADDDDNKEFSKELVRKREDIDKSLKINSRLPDEILLFITTSKCKEGINILDEDIKTMFAESHYYNDLIQMAGRVRKGLNDLFVIKDVRPNHSALSLFEAEINRNCAETVSNTYNDYKSMCEERHISYTEKSLITTVERIFPAVRFNYITRQFESYEGKIHGVRDYCENINNLSDYVECWNDPINEYGEQGCQLFHRWFPYSEIWLYNQRGYSSEEVKAIILNFLTQHNYIDREITERDKDIIRGYINRTFASYGKRVAEIKLPVRSLGPALKHVGLVMRNSGRNGSGKAIITYISAPAESITSGNKRDNIIGD